MWLRVALCRCLVADLRRLRELSLIGLVGSSLLGSKLESAPMAVSGKCHKHHPGSKIQKDATILPHPIRSNYH